MVEVIRRAVSAPSPVVFMPHAHAGRDVDDGVRSPVLS
jgi:hypothetical protein